MSVPSPTDDALVEGFARVVAVEGVVAWLEPEATTSCSGCSASSACGSPGGIGTVASRIEARRFSLPNDQGYVVGERVVIGVREQALVKASLTAYAIPLLCMLVAAVVAQWRFGRDEITLAASLIGLVMGFSVARVSANYLRARGGTTLRFVRRADEDASSQRVSTKIQRIERCKNT